MQWKSRTSWPVFSVNGLVRSWAFFRKEVAELVRQPKLVVTLVLAPFLILALFGAGYRQTNGPLRTIFVSGDEETFQSVIEPRLAELGNALESAGVTESRESAVGMLRTGGVDVVVVVPDDPESTIRNNEQAVFEVLHDQLDPYERATIGLITQAAVDAVNRSILEELVAEGQVRSDDVALTEARETSTALRVAMERGDQLAARNERNRLTEQLDAWASAGEGNGSTGLADAEGPNPSALHDRAEQLDVASQDSSELEAVRSLEADLIELDDAAAEFRSIEPTVIVSPFEVATDLVGSTELSVTDFYAPGVIALLLQHLAITFAGLSLVRERALGTTELFKVAPLRATQMLVGKYLGYAVVAALVAVALSGLMFWGFGVPFLGSVADYAMVLALLVVASLGVGFVVSSVVSSDTQAVNASMFMLLMSIFFSGFFLSIDRLVPEVQAVSWALPITHALDSLRDVLFRGVGIDLRTTFALGGGALALFAAAAVLTHRRLAAD